MPLNVRLEVVHHGNDVADDSLVDRAGHERLLGSEHLRRLGEDHASTERRQAVVGPGMLGEGNGGGRLLSLMRDQGHWPE